MTTMVRTAGAVGVPAWQMDRSFETDTAAALERHFAEEDFPIDLIEGDFSTAEDQLDQVLRFLIRAADLAENYGKAKPIDELIETLDDEFRDKLHNVLKKLKEGA